MRQKIIRFSNLYSFKAVSTEPTSEIITCFIGSNRCGNTAFFRVLCQVFALDFSWHRIQSLKSYLSQDEYRNDTCRGGTLNISRSLTNQQLTI